jgi:K+/H+ antiporter YhaU regulatory subunit KhtT
MKAGYNRGKANPCLFYSPTDDCSIMVHGDDFVAVGDEKSTQKLKKSLEAAYKV